MLREVYMKTINGLIIGVLLGLGAGLWMGVNIGRDLPLTTNPFNPPTVSETLGDKAGRIYDKTKDAINEEFK